MTDGDVILTRDRSSGRVHKRVRQGAHLLTNEQCNLDDAGHFLIIEDVSDVDASSLCQNCFPPVVTINAPEVTRA